MSLIYQPQGNLEPILEKIGKKWHVSLPDAPCTYQAQSDDFGVEIKELLLSPKIEERRENPVRSLLAKKKMWQGITFLHTAENMLAIGEELGITIRQPEAFFYPRDTFLRLGDGSIRVPHASPHLAAAIERVRSSNLYLDSTAATRTKNQLFNGWTGYAYLFSSEAAKAYQAVFQEKPVSFDSTYAEGGNVWTLTNREGVAKVLVGRDNAKQTLLQLDLEGKLSVETQRLALTEEEMARSAEEMFSEGLLQQNGKTGIIDRKQQLILMTVKFMTGSNEITLEERNWLRRLAEGAGIIAPLGKGDWEGAVQDYLAKKALVHRLMAQDFKVEPQNLHLIEQANYHLDLFSKPGPNHSIFLNSFALCADLLEAISQECDLTEGDREHLARYLATAQKFDRELGPLLEQVAKQFEEAGFTVIPMPGHFLYETAAFYKEFLMPSEGYNINFINALSGWSAKKEQFFYIAHGLQIGERLGGLIMEAFAGFMQHYIPNLALYFIGRKPDDLADFSEAMDWWNRLETQSGIHCATFELSKASHTV